MLNIAYDVLPQRHVTLVATEIGLIPPTSVPVIVREFKKDAESQFASGFLSPKPA